MSGRIPQTPGCDAPACQGQPGRRPDTRPAERWGRARYRIFDARTLGRQGRRAPSLSAESQGHALDGPVEHRWLMRSIHAAIWNGAKRTPGAQHLRRAVRRPANGSIVTTLNDLLRERKSDIVRVCERPTSGGCRSSGQRWGSRSIPRAVTSISSWSRRRRGTTYERDRGRSTSPCAPPVRGSPRLSARLGVDQDATVPPVAGDAFRRARMRSWSRGCVEKYSPRSS